MTDTQLKIALAKMLPEKIELTGETICWLKPWTLSYLHRRVRDTELLHVCWLIEDGLAYEDKAEFARQLYRQDGFFSCVDCEDNDFSEIFKYSHATWQQRATALAKVKGVEL